MSRRLFTDTLKVKEDILTFSGELKCAKRFEIGRISFEEDRFKCRFLFKIDKRLTFHR